MNTKEHKADRKKYRQVWYQAKRERLHQKRGCAFHRRPPKMDPEAAKQWLADRAAAREAAREPARILARKRIRERWKRRAEAPARKAARLARVRENHRHRYHSDPDFRDTLLSKSKAWYQRNRDRILPALRERRRILREQRTP